MITKSAPLWVFESNEALAGGVPSSGVFTYAVTDPTHTNTLSPASWTYSVAPLGSNRWNITAGGIGGGEHSYASGNRITISTVAGKFKDLAGNAASATSGFVVYGACRAVVLIA